MSQFHEMQRDRNLSVVVVTDWDHESVWFLIKVTVEPLGMVKFVIGVTIKPLKMTWLLIEATIEVRGGGAARDRCRKCCGSIDPLLDLISSHGSGLGLDLGMGRNAQMVQRHGERVLGWVGVGLAALSYATDSSPIHSGALDGNQEVHGGVQKPHPSCNLCLGGTLDEMLDDIESIVTLKCKRVLKPIVVISFLHTIAKLLVLQSFDKYIFLFPQGFNLSILRGLWLFLYNFKFILFWWFRITNSLLVPVSTYWCHGFAGSLVMDKQQEDGG
uniref:Uncharacterized protein n=1 Tax=Fagus sylvatica TaxID=28930 RepID=A0A2N9FY55_FAGSY